MLYSEILSAAYEIIASGNERFICHALWNASPADGIDLSLVVQYRIHPYDTADEFVASSLGFRGERVSGPLHSFLDQQGVDMRKWRLDFLSHLIIKYKALGQ